VSLVISIMRSIRGRLSKDDGFAELLLGSSVALILKVFAAAVGFLMSLVIARQLGAEEAGYFFLAFSILNVLASLGRYGYDNALVRYIAASQTEGLSTEVNGLYRLALVRSILICMILAVGLYWFAPTMAYQVFNKPAVKESLQLVALCLVPFSLTSLHAFAFQGMKKIALSVSCLSLFIPISTLTGVWLLALGDARFATLALLASSVLGLIASALIWWLLVGRTAHTLASVRRVRFQLAAKRLFGVKFFSLIVQWGSPLLLGVWAIASDLAVFTIAQRTSALTSFVLLAVNAIAAPNYAALYSQGKFAELRSTALHSTRLLIATSMPIFVLMLLYPSWLMGWFGEEFSRGALCLVILACGQFINVCTGSVGFLLQMTGHENLLRNNLVVSALIIIVGGSLVIPSFGIVGAATITAIAVVLQNVLGVWQVKRVLGFNTMVFWRSSKN
jgi:O-antigen/teichoic acid export membrane protein